MLSRVEIKNYRGFRAFKAEGLSRVNLFVGKNNSGKTAVLEGIQLLTSHGDPGVLAEVADRRGEIILSRPETNSRQIDIAHFFHGHTFAADSSITFQGDNGYQPIVVNVFSPKREQSDTSKQRTSQDLALRIGGTKQEDRPVFPISREGGVDLDVPSRFRGMGNVRRSRGPQVRFVGPESLNTVELAVMWDDITLSGQEVDVASALRVLDPNLESLHFLTGMLASGYFPSRAGIVVGLKGTDGRIPIGSMGDGMRRLMAISTSLAFTKEGCLFVDEIDTGLHYSIMADMWRLIVMKAIASNTQVFATTHSWDCIEGLSQLLGNSPEFSQEVAIHKIDRQLSHSVGFSGDSIVGMIKSHIDPR